MIVAILRNKFSYIRSEISQHADAMFLDIFLIQGIQIVGVKIGDRTGDGNTFSGFFDAQNKRVYRGEDIEPDILRNRTGGTCLELYKSFDGYIYPSQKLKKLSLDKWYTYTMLSDVHSYTQLLECFDLSKFQDDIVLKPYTGTGKSKGVYICQKNAVSDLFSAKHINVTSYMAQQYHDFRDDSGYICEWRVVCSSSEIYYVEKKYKKDFEGVSHRSYISQSELPNILLKHINDIRLLFTDIGISEDDIYGLDWGYDMTIDQRILIEMNASP